MQATHTDIVAMPKAPAAVVTINDNRLPVGVSTFESVPLKLGSRLGVSIVSQDGRERAVYVVEVARAEWSRH